MKVLFLDIDGVLNSLMWIEKLGGKFGRGPSSADEIPTRESLSWHPETVDELRRIVRETECSIVISSSWRGWGDQAIKVWQSMFGCYGWPDAPVIGETPSLPYWNGMVRGDEINAWLKDHPEVTQFACLDDDDDFHTGQNLVKTDIRFGLTRLEGNDLIKRLCSPLTTHDNHQETLK